LKPTTAIFSLSLLAALCISCSTGEKAVTLRLKSEPGTKTYFTTTFKGSAKGIEGDSITFDRSNELTILTEETTRRIVDDSVAEILQTNFYKQRTVNHKDSSVIDTSFQGEELIISLSPRGKLIDIEYASPEEKGDLTYMKNFIDQAWPVFPAEEVTVGQTWTQTSKIVHEDIPLQTSTMYRVTAFVREQGYDCVVIEYEGRLVIPIQPDPAKKDFISGVNRITLTGVCYHSYTEGVFVLQREKRVIDGDRRMYRDGIAVSSKTKAEYDVELVLTKREKSVTST